MKGLVDCSKVYVDDATGKGAGAFAAVDIKEGEIVETGIVRRLPDGFDGHASPYVFTWSEDRTVWAMGSGCATFYNCDASSPNTKMHRNFDDDSFTIVATRDIAAGEELLHTYKSLPWRGCFEDLRADG